MSAYANLLAGHAGASPGSVDPASLGYTAITAPPANGPVVLSNSTPLFDDQATAPTTVIGGDGTNQVIRSGAGNLTFWAGKGGGAILAGGAFTSSGSAPITDNVIGTPLTGGGDWAISTGPGHDTIAAASGNDSISTQTGSSQIFLGSGNDMVVSGGNDTISGGSGPATIQASTAGDEVFAGGAAALNFLNADGASTLIGGSGDATVYGGTGQVTLFGGASMRDLFFAGQRGGNTLVAGAGLATLGGAGGGNVFVAGSGGDLIAVGPGRNTVFGGAGNDTISTGRGSTVVIAGTGADQIIAGSGQATLQAGGGRDLFVFVTGMSGGSDLITGFTPGLDHLVLDGYGANAAAPAIAGATPAAGGMQLHLGDGTTITLAGLSKISRGMFA